MDRGGRRSSPVSHENRAETSGQAIGVVQRVVGAQLAAAGQHPVVPLHEPSAVHGVAAVTATQALPIVEGEPHRRFTIAGRAAPAPAALPWASEGQPMRRN